MMPGDFMRIFLITILFTLISAFPVSAEENGIKITELAVTTKIVKGNPIDAVHRISSASVKNLFCFTRVTAPAGTNTTIRHLWYNGEEKVGEYELPVKGEKWRTFSMKTIQKGWAGEWRVDVLDSSGRLMKSVKFRMN
jgi:hypothetical protein